LVAGGCQGCTAIVRHMAGGSLAMMWCNGRINTRFMYAFFVSPQPEPPREIYIRDRAYGAHEGVHASP
ncbi:MAG: hypothetical protein PHW58_00580, partial [Candidatus Methanofastidiosa archaeon]|nr:hypothetical protein [Candidatus Methanofastidiosa archaeon]